MKVAGAVAGRLAGAIRAAMPPLWQRLPRSIRDERRYVASINRTLLALGASPLVIAEMQVGHRLWLDLRSGSEWLSYYTGRFDDGRIAAACALLRRRGCVAVDAGANIGLWTVPLARKAAALGGYVIAIEPVPANAKRLRENIRLNGLEAAAFVFELAVSDGHGTVTMSLREDFADGAGTGNAAVVIDDGTDDRFTTLEVRATTLDDALGGCGRPSIDVIKADLEGHEDRFLAGANETFTTDRPVAFVEWNRIYYERRGVDPTEATRHLLRQWEYLCLRHDCGQWLSSVEFRSTRPLDDLVLVPADRRREVKALLEATHRGIA
jgi:FkbM family methyltransferase